MSKTKPKILYVDDEKNNLIVVKADLGEKFDVTCFQSAAEALKELSQVKPQIILSDLRMPGMDGIRFLEEAQKAWPFSIRVVITGNSDEESVIQAIKKASISDYIKKPFADNELEEAMLRAYQKYLNLPDIIV